MFIDFQLPPWLPTAAAFAALGIILLVLLHHSYDTARRSRGLPPSADDPEALEQEIYDSVPEAELLQVALAVMDAVKDLGRIRRLAGTIPPSLSNMLDENRAWRLRGEQAAEDIQAVMLSLLASVKHLEGLGDDSLDTLNRRMKLLLAAQDTKDKEVQ